MTKVIPTDPLRQELTTQTVTSSLPAFMQQFVGDGTETMHDYFTPPIMRIVQRQSRKPIIDMFQPGSVIAVPILQLIAQPSEKFYIVPLLFYPEWVAWNPIQARNILPAVRDKSLDPRSVIALKARNPITRKEPCPDSREGEIRYLEHLNFIVHILPPNPLANIPIVMSFSSGEYRTGSNFSTLIQMRRAPIYGCQFEVTVAERSNNKGNWFGFDIRNPSVESNVPPFVMDEKLFEQYKALHAEYKSVYEKRLLQTQYEEPDSVLEAQDTF